MSDTVKLVECPECEGNGVIERDAGGGNVEKCWCKTCEGWGFTKEYIDELLPEYAEEDEDGLSRCPNCGKVSTVDELRFKLNGKNDFYCPACGFKQEEE